MKKSDACPTEKCKDLGKQAVQVSQMKLIIQTHQALNTEVSIFGNLIRVCTYMESNRAILWA